MKAVLIKMVAMVPMLAFGIGVTTASPAAAYWPQQDWRWHHRAHHLHHWHQHYWRNHHYHPGHYNPPPRPYYPPPHHRGW